MRRALMTGGVWRVVGACVAAAAPSGCASGGWTGWHAGAQASPTALAADDRLTIPQAASVDAARVHQALSSGDVRVIALGDSFAAPVWGRVFPAALRVWPYGPLTAVAGGASSYSQLVQGVAHASPAVDIQGGPGTYELLRGEATRAYFGLPTRGMHEIRGSPDLVAPGSDLLEVRLWDGSLEGAPGGRLTGEGTHVSFRMLYWVPPNAGLMIERVAVRFGDEPESLHALAWDADRAGQISAASAVVVRRLDGPEDKPAAVLREVAPLAGSGRYVHPAGGVFARVTCEGERLAGVYYGSLADVSWSYAGFGADRPCAGPKDKVFSRAQLAAWLGATTLDAAQPVVMFWYLAAESAWQAEAEALLGAMIDVASGAAADAGAPAPLHCLVLPHFHSIGSLGTGSGARERFEAQREAMFALALRRDDVAAVSIYDATEGVLFDGSDAARGWLKARGYERFEYAGRVVDLVGGAGGALLDRANLHPAGEDAAAFFAHVLATELAQ